jgi:hypothetical protein
MPVTLEQSIQIYAQASRSWFGSKASQKTQERIDHLSRKGDLEVVKIHELVKRHIGLIEQQRAASRPNWVDRTSIKHR